jgi:hypothetical protein
MIVIIDPLVTGFSHEMVNAGFVYSISKNNKDKKILFIAEEKHIECIKNIFLGNDYNPTNIEYISNNNIFDFVRISTMLRNYANKNLIEKYVFLSFNAITVSLIYKFILKIPVYLVCHAIFENIIDNSNKREGILKTKKDILNKLTSMNFFSLLKLFLTYSKMYFSKFFDIIKDKFFNFKNIFFRTIKA